MKSDKLVNQFMKLHGTVSTANELQTCFMSYYRTKCVFLFIVDGRSQFPMQPTFNNQIQQGLFNPQQFQETGFPFGAAPPQPSINQLSNSIGLTPLQHVLPQRTRNRPAYTQNGPMRSSIGQSDMSPVTVNVPMAAPEKIPSFLTASQVYKDFEDVNSRSHLSDDIFGSQSKCFTEACVSNCEIWLHSHAGK